MSEIREKDWDRCECGHIRWQHLRGGCRGVDSYGVPCKCPSFDLDVESIDAPDDLVAGLSEVYKPEGVLIWLRGRNRNLELFTPLELIAVGREAEVRAEIERLVGGSW
jgi:hypothetical protein